jgi:hypothetical protein
MERQYSSYKERYITNKYGVGEIYCDALAASTPVLLLVEFFISFFLVMSSCHLVTKTKGLWLVSQGMFLVKRVKIAIFQGKRKLELAI